jgi:RimJ/RimL family protein N-acetyltransferase
MMIKGTKVKLRLKTIKDAAQDYKWQRDSELSDLDAVSPLPLSFREYLEEYKDTLRHPSPYRRTFAVLTHDGKHIGNCVYYNIDRVSKQAEIGIMIGDRDFWNKGFGTDTINTLSSYVFRHDGFKRLYLKTLTKNVRAQQSFKKSGYSPYGNLERDGYQFLLMELPRERWQKSLTSTSG